MDIADLLTELQALPTYAEQLVHLHEEPARAARYADPSHPLAGSGQALLGARGIPRLYTHQAQALDALRAGQDIVIATGTASGKSLCYTLPVLEMLGGESSTALLLFPGKALCQDQFQRLHEALQAAELSHVLAGVYDGDTPAALRRRLRERAEVILSNPDMLHAGMLPQHAHWASFLARLRYLVLDEVHTYTSIFGSNMGNLLRRLFRLCAHYGSAPQVIACSATLHRPQQLLSHLTGRPCVCIDNDGSPHGKRTYLFWNPRRERESTWRSRRSANVEAQELMALFIQHGVRTITFSKAKMTAEMIYRYVATTLRASAPHLIRKLAPYRGGYLPEERRGIERALFSGELLGVSTTRALELGIDVGGLDASILVGYPGTRSGFFQQAGRAGRGSGDALVVLVGLDTPANQYIMSHPEYLFDRPLERAVLDVDNPFVLSGHLRCAAQELALSDGEAPLFGPHAPMVLNVLQDNAKIRRLGERWYHAAPEIPQHEVRLRGYADSNVVIEDAGSGAIIGALNKFDAPDLLHPEAIYLHHGDSYRVLSLDLSRNIARVLRVEVDYYTQPLGGTDVHHIDHTLKEKPFGTGRAYWGEVTSTFHCWGFEKVRFYELEAISRHPLDLPTFTLETTACWIVPPDELLREVQAAGLDAYNGLRGIGFATRMLAPLYLTCDTLDFSHTVGSVNAPWQAVFLYERYPHGLGFSEVLYRRVHEISLAVQAVIAACPCADGCPCCVGKPLRGELVWNPERGEATIPSKRAALAILRGLLGDGDHLQEADVQQTSTDAGAEEIRLERLLRRRLEQMREPQVWHPIDPSVPTEIPAIEDAGALEQADVARRITGRRAFDKALRQRIAEHNLPPEPVKPPHPPAPAGAHGVNTPRDYPAAPPVTPKKLGDSLAAQCRRLKPQQKDTDA